jgi:hypothetical protein
MTMPRFFFQFQHPERIESDSLGLEFPDARTAILEARRTAAEMMRDAAMAGRKLNGAIEVLDSDGVVILRVRSVEDPV